jgi:hypothetical protein
MAMQHRPVGQCWRSSLMTAAGEQRRRAGEAMLLAVIAHRAIEPGQLLVHRG